MDVKELGRIDSSAWRVGECFFQLYDHMLRSPSLADVLGELREVVCSVMSAEATTVYLLRPETQSLEASVLVHNVPRIIRIPVQPDSLAGYCAHSGRSFRVPDAYADLSAISPALHFDRSWDDAHGFRTRDVMCAPAIARGETVGVVQVLNSRGDPFDESDLAALESVARLVGYALHHARLYDDLAGLRQLQKEKAKFMLVMVHELKSPVAAAKMMQDLLTHDLLPQDEIPKTLAKMGARLDSLLHMITDILDLSGFSSGEAMGKIEVVDLSAALSEVAERYRDQAEHKGLRFDVSLAAEPLRIRIDTRGLAIVFSNLISNAVKYTAKGSVRISLSREGGAAVLRVRDTGIGVPSAEIPKLFREFFRASNAKKAKIEGTGVGLAGIRQLVERFGGELRLESKEDEGSEFSVHLPLRDEAQAGVE